jgi:hypothetical protein
VILNHDYLRSSASDYQKFQQLVACAGAFGRQRAIVTQLGNKSGKTENFIW